MKETGINAFMLVILRILMVLVCSVAGYETAFLLLRLQPEWITELAHQNIWAAVCILIFALVGFMITPLIWWILKRIGQLFENALQNVSIKDIFVAITGLIVSLLIATLIAIPFRDVSGIGFYIAIALYIVFAFIGVRAFVKKRDDIISVINNLIGRDGPFGLRRASRTDSKKETREDDQAQSPTEPLQCKKKIVDTSVLIDGRLLDIADTGFMEGELILPRFVLTELQAVADSSDPVKRARGRKGLSIVTELQKKEALRVSIDDTSMKELGRNKVDEALVELCKRSGAKIITTDYNLNQISKIEGVDVLNINDLANSLKPQFLPGDIVKIEIIRHGKEKGQGIGYLEDGTMLVVEDGEGRIGDTVEIAITSMLQTAAGRMVFGRLKR